MLMRMWDVPERAGPLSGRKKLHSTDPTTRASKEPALHRVLEHHTGGDLFEVADARERFQHRERQGAGLPGAVAAALAADPGALAAAGLALQPRQRAKGIGFRPKGEGCCLAALARTIAVRVDSDAAGFGASRSAVGGKTAKNTQQMQQVVSTASAAGGSAGSGPAAAPPASSAWPGCWSSGIFAFSSSSGPSFVWVEEEGEGDAGARRLFGPS